jgi:erythronate-4-phosphate dehydrogenase
MLKLLADENIAGIDTFFMDMDVTVKPGREISPKDLLGVDILLVRSVTKVNRTLLEYASSLKFIGSATIGVDHIDIDYLQSIGIVFSNAPGCNAQGVCEYVMSSIAYLKPSIFSDPNATVGIIGCGHVGSKVYRVLKDLDVSVSVYDPLKGDEVLFKRGSLEQVLSCDVVTLHVPFTDCGLHATHNMLDQEQLDTMKDSALLINTSRGGVVNEHALSNWLSTRKNSLVALDVWKNEPNINKSLLERCDIATPHIAGYSLRGKWRGTFALYKAVREFLGMPLDKGMSDMPTQIQHVDLTQPIEQLFLKSYQIKLDSDAMKSALLDSSQDIGCEFDMLRKQYFQRCEWEDSIDPSSAFTLSKAIQTLTE